jgi:hypothetical protein
MFRRTVIEDVRTLMTSDEAAQRSLALLKKLFETLAPKYLHVA